MLPDVLLSTF